MTDRLQNLIPNKDAASLNIEPLGKSLGPAASLPIIGLKLKNWDSDVPKQAPFFQYKQIALSFMAASGQSRDEALQKVDQLCTPDVKLVTLSNNLGDSFKELVDVTCRLIRASFPDFRCRVFEETYREQGNQAFFDCRDECTFTGKPYAFPPGVATPVQATGQWCPGPVCQVTLTFNDDGKISLFECSDPKDGEYDGPLALYLRVGGKAPASKYENIARRMIELHESPDVERGMVEIFANNGVIEFEDVKLTPAHFAGSIKTFLQPAFKDFKLTMIENSYKEVDQHVSFEVQVSGVHTAPYSLPPAGLVEPIAATGRNLRDIIGHEKVFLVFNNEAKIVRLAVHNVGGDLGGPVGAYLGLGGQMKQSVVERNIKSVKRMYSFFTQGNVAGILKFVDEKADWVWGQEHEGFRALPWYGRWVGHAGLTTAFQRIGASSDWIKFQPKSFVASADGKSVITNVEGIVRRQGGQEARAINTITHVFEFNDQGMVIRYRDRSDVTHILPMFQQ